MHVVFQVTRPKNQSAIANRKASFFFAFIILLPVWMGCSQVNLWQEMQIALQSGQNSSQPPEEPQLTGSVSILTEDGTSAREGVILVVDVDNLAGSGTITYQWKRGNTVTDIEDAVTSGIDQEMYTLTAADERKYFTVTVTREGYTGSVTSGPIGPVGFAWIEPGTFTMGSPASETGRGNNETQHHVTLTKGFYMGVYPVTQALYQAVIGSNPSDFTDDPEDGEDQEKRPVDTVNWYDALVFCNKLSMRDGLTPVYSINGSTEPEDWGSSIQGSGSTANAWGAVTMSSTANGYRLPTEAEWEYACRANTATAYNLGDTWDGAWGWYDGNSGFKTHEAGKKLPNAWGLYDMHGNVWEWCWDWYDANYYTTSGAGANPTGPATGFYRVLRGGGCRDSKESARSAARGSNKPEDGGSIIGFRVVRGQ
jgi:formylglycine-generating enzyme